MKIRNRFLLSTGILAAAIVAAGFGYTGGVADGSDVSASTHAFTGSTWLDEIDPAAIQAGGTATVKVTVTGWTDGDLLNITYSDTSMLNNPPAAIRITKDNVQFDLNASTSASAGDITITVSHGSNSDDGVLSITN